MDHIRIVGVPEHFNFPWVKIVEEQPLQKEGIILEWKDEPKGSGAMNKAIREGEADVAVVLTESFIKDKTEGNPGKIIGYHVSTPLIWGIHISSRFNIEKLDELRNIPFLISRYGSGSHLMAFLLAAEKNWDTGQLLFEVVGDLDGALKSMETDAPRLFLWEKYTTMPFVRKGLFNRVGEIPTPWPCFVAVASPEILAKYPRQLKKLMDSLYSTSSSLQQHAQLPIWLSTKYGIEMEDIQEWVKQTRWATKGEIQKSSLEETMKTLKALKLVSKEIAAEELVAQGFVTLVQNGF